MTDFKKFSGGT